MTLGNPDRLALQFVPCVYPETRFVILLVWRNSIRKVWRWPRKWGILSQRTTRNNSK